jgi:hypothetical protein
MLRQSVYKAGLSTTINELKEKIKARDKKEASKKL